MKRFSFRLQKVLDLRKALRRGALAQVARALFGLNAEKQGLQRLRGARLQAWQDLHRQLTSRGDQLGVHLREVSMIDEALEQGALRCRQAEKAVCVARTQERRARAAVDSFEHLRERELEEYRRETRLSEGKEMDEVASLRHGRDSGGIR